MFNSNQTVVYRNENHRVICQQSADWVRLAEHPNDKEGFAVHNSLVTATDVVAVVKKVKAPVVKAPKVKKAKVSVMGHVTASVEVARTTLQSADSWSALYKTLQKSGYFRNELRTYMKESRDRLNFGMLKGVMIAKVAKIVRERQPALGL